MNFKEIVMKYRIGFIWATICVLIIPATFMGNIFFAKQLVKLPFMKVNPVFTGGDIYQSFDDNGLTITLYKPVFEALIGKSSSGFVQVRFSAKDKLPLTIDRKIDYNNDGMDDFRLIINTQSGTTGIESLNNHVKDIRVSSRVKTDWIVRVNLHK